MNSYESGGDDAERRRRTQAGGAEVAQLWEPAATGVPPEVATDEYEREIAVHRRASSGSSIAGSSSAGASSSRLAPVKREPEELGPFAVKLEADADPPRRAVIGPEDYLPPGQEDHLERAIMERSAREEEEAAASSRSRRSSSSRASQAHASKEADLRIMKAEQAKVWIDLDNDED